MSELTDRAIFCVTYTAHDEENDRHIVDGYLLACTGPERFQYGDGPSICAWDFESRECGDDIESLGVKQDFIGKRAGLYRWTGFIHYCPGNHYDSICDCGPEIIADSIVPATVEDLITFGLLIHET